MGANADQLIAIRMSVGTLMRFDFEAARNYAAAHVMGKRIIQYHYCGNNDPTTEAKLFLAACSPFAQYDMYCIDAELEQSKAWKQTFADVVKAATGCNVIDYMNISTANALGALPDCALWLAAPSYVLGQVIGELNPKYEYLFQQGAIVDGVDTDAAFTTIPVLDKYGYQPPAVPTSSTTTTLTTTTSTSSSTSASTTTSSTSSSSTTSTTTTTLPHGTIDGILPPKKPVPPEDPKPVVGPVIPPSPSIWQCIWDIFLKVIYRREL